MDTAVITRANGRKQTVHIHFGGIEPFWATATSQGNDRGYTLRGGGRVVEKQRWRNGECIESKQLVGATWELT